MEVAKIRGNVEEERETNMARFFHWIIKEISDVVELHHVELGELMHQAIKFEQ